ncbi:MAG TPA: GNAT family N-acetyltransferase [Acetobacteraceae bacterium]|nr:GNAT family N-acetyltransferase [Acetobacteraceae bacterium]HQU01914.1 GNAT family N-acetyltransferase [Acetobacteraceae bacterium]
MSQRYISVFSSFELPPVIADVLGQILDDCFPAMFEGRVYVKQLPHMRIVAFENGAPVGQVGIDHRIINVGGDVKEIFGLIDLCVAREWRNQEIAGALVARAEALAIQAGVAFMVLMADRHDLYIRHGFSRVQPAPATWYGIDERQSIGLITRDLSDCFMIKPVVETHWPVGPIDMLGYLF